MYKEGKANGIFELLEVIKSAALSAGWEVLNDVTTPYNDVPREGKYCIIPVGNANAISEDTTMKTDIFNVVLPRVADFGSLRFNGDKVSIYKVYNDQTKELLCSEVENGYSLQAKDIIQFRVEATKPISDFHIDFTSQTKVLSCYLVLKNNLPNDNQVILNLKAFIEPNGRTNLAISSSTGFSPNLDIHEQLNTKVGYILGDDDEIKYHLSVNNSRIILTTVIRRTDNSYQPNEYFQIAYIGRLRLYGGEWALPDCNALIAPSFKSDFWYQAPKSNVIKPFVYYSGSFGEVNSTAFSKETVNNVNCNITAPQNGEIFATPISTHKFTSNTINIAIMSVYEI